MNKFFAVIIFVLVGLQVLLTYSHFETKREQDTQITHIKWRLDNLEALNAAEAQKAQQEPTCHH